MVTDHTETQESMPLIGIFFLDAGLNSVMLLCRQSITEDNQSQTLRLCNFWISEH